MSVGRGTNVSCILSFKNVDFLHLIASLPLLTPWFCSCFSYCVRVTSSWQLLPIQAVWRRWRTSSSSSTLHTASTLTSSANSWTLCRESSTPSPSARTTSGSGSQPSATKSDWTRPWTSIRINCRCGAPFVRLSTSSRLGPGQATPSDTRTPKCLVWVWVLLK